MSKTTKLLPELRFPEFREDGEWKELPLGNFLYEHKVKSDGQCEVHSVSVHKGVINQKEHLGRSFAAKDTSNYNLAHPKDVIYTKSPTGHFAFGNVKQSHLEINVIVSPLYGVFTPITPEAGYIIHCFFESPQRALKYLDPITQKGAKNTIQITNQGFLSGLVRFPLSPSEQQKIANCLGSLDDLITAHSRKLDALQDHKKGLLQQLFPAEGETTPELRFPEFEGEWKGKPLKKLATYQNGKAYEKHIFDEGKYVVVNSRFVSTDGKVKKFTNSEFCAARKGDVLMVLSDLPKGRALAKCFFVTEDSKYGVNQRVSRLQSININDKFLYYRLNRHRSLLAYDDGITQTHLSKSDVEDCVLSVPSDLQEQLAIAECLTALDALITTQTEQIAALKTHKKGLMQQLFPNPERNKV